MNNIDSRAMNELLRRASAVEFYPSGTVKRIEFCCPVPQPPITAPLTQRTILQVRTKAYFTKVKTQQG